MKEDWKDNLDIIDLDPTGTMPTIPVLPAEDDILSGNKDKEEEKPDGEKVTESASPEEELSGTEAGEEADPETVQAGEEYVPDEVQSAEEQAPEELQPGEEEISGTAQPEEEQAPEEDHEEEPVYGIRDDGEAEDDFPINELAEGDDFPEEEAKMFHGVVSIDTMLLTDVSDEIALNMGETRPIPSLSQLGSAAGSTKAGGEEEDESGEAERAALLEARTQVVAPRSGVPFDTIKIADIDDLLPEIDISDALNDEEAFEEAADPEGEALYAEDAGEAYPGEDENVPDNEESYAETEEDVSAAGEDYPEEDTEYPETDENVPGSDADDGDFGADENEAETEDDYPEEERIFETGELIGLGGEFDDTDRRRKDRRRDESEDAEPGDEEDDGEGEGPAGEPRKHEKPRRRKTRGRRGSGRRFALIFLAATILLCLIAEGILLLLSKKGRESGEPPLYAVGQQFAAIGTAGQSGLIAMAEAGKNVVPPPEEDEPTPTPEPGETTKVKLSFTSVEQDIKIKFIDAGTDRLIRDVVFEVVLTPDGGATLQLKDEDRDGIIYKKEVKSGQYRFAVADAKGYEFVDVPNTVNVREKIVYQKIDVKDEIKTEAEVNAGAEDTGNSKPPEEAAEPANKDTVEWVESSKKPKEGSDGYKKVKAEDIPEPAYKKNDDSSAKVDVPVPVPVPVPAASAASVTKSGSILMGEEEPTSIPLETPTSTPTPTEGEEKEPTPTKGEGGEGSATPTPTKGEGGEGSATPTPTKAGDKDPREDKTTKLTDKNGKQLYYKDGDKYVEAVYADYYTKKEFFIETEIEYIYTGWQTLNGNTYYFDKNGNYVTGDQVIKGVNYHFNEDGILAQNNKNGVLGIDVSKWNGSINWTAVKNAGVNFVIIRCGYRGSATGVLVEDPTFRSNIQGARAAGLKVGLYFFTQAVNEVEAVEEASMCLSLASSYEVSYPIFIDTEFTVNKNGRADKLDKAGRTAVCRAFCETIRNGGYTAGVYSSKSWLGPMVDIGSLGGYRVWLAHYTKQTDYAGHYDIWQYSSKGSIDGIKGNVDLNWSYLGY